MSSRPDDAFVELTLAFANDAYPAVRISDALDCRVELLDAIRSGADGTGVTEYLQVATGSSGVAVEQARAAERGERADVVDRFDGTTVVEVTIERSVVGTLVDERALPQSAVVTDGTARLVAAVAPSRDPGSVVATVEARHPSIRLVGKHRRDRPATLETRSAFRGRVDERLTERQSQALRLAYARGYFERPRERTQAALADEMDIAASTFGQHLHAGLRKLLGALLDEHLADERQSP